MLSQLEKAAAEMYKSGDTSESWVSLEITPFLILKFSSWFGEKEESTVDEISQKKNLFLHANVIYAYYYLAYSLFHLRNQENISGNLSCLLFVHSSRRQLFSSLATFFYSTHMMPRSVLLSKKLDLFQAIWGTCNEIFGRKIEARPCSRWTDEIWYSYSLPLHFQYHSLFCRH